MVDLTAPLDAAIEAVTRLRASLAKGLNRQVRNSDERMLIKATSQAWFRSRTCAVMDADGHWIPAWRRRRIPRRAVRFHC